MQEFSPPSNQEKREGFLSEYCAIAQCVLPEHSDLIDQWIIERLQSTLYKFLLVKVVEADVQEHGCTHVVMVHFNDPAVIPHTEDSLTWRELEEHSFGIPITLPNIAMVLFLMKRVMLSVSQGRIPLDITVEGNRLFWSREVQMAADKLSGIFHEVETSH